MNSPTDGGAPIFAWRVDSYMNLKPVTAEGGAGGGRGRHVDRPAGRIGAVVVLGIVAFVVMNRRRSEEDEA